MALLVREMAITSRGMKIYVSRRQNSVKASWRNQVAEAAGSRADVVVV